MTENPTPQKTITRTHENSWGKRHSLLIKLLAVILLVLLCCILSWEILRREICKVPGRAELFSRVCKKEREAQFWEACKESDRNRPPNTEVLVSACMIPVATGMPGGEGEVLFVREALTGEMYLLDLRTGEKRGIPNDPLFLDKGVFLSSELVWLDGSSLQPESPYYRPHYILDMTDGQRYELLDLTWLPRLEPGKLDPKYLAYFQSAEQVFIERSQDKLIALAPDFHQQHSGVILSGSALGYETVSGKLLEQLMKELGVDYQIVDFYAYLNVPSPTGRYYTIRGNDIYLSGTNTLVVSGEWQFISWYYDESGVIIHEGVDYTYTLPGGAKGLPIYHPILKLRLPKP